MGKGLCRMEIEISRKQKDIVLYGVWKVHNEKKSFGEEITELLDQVWPEVKSKGLNHTGINHVVYDCNDIVFAGIELRSPPSMKTSLQARKFSFPQYAYWKHIGPYDLLGDVHKDINETLEALGQQAVCPNMEVYGHWNEDTSKLETEIFYNLK